MIYRHALSFGAFAAVFAPAAPVLAHHSFAAEFDSNTPLTLKGKVTKVEWTNPHAHCHIDVKDSSGRVVNWDFELGSPNNLIDRKSTRLNSSHRT